MNLQFFWKKQKIHVNKDIGTENPGSCKYILNNISFDSSWELAFYIWHKDNNIQIERETKIFYYLDKNNKRRKYISDFFLPKTNEIIEIKGGQFLDKDNTLLNKGKWKCMCENEVKMLTYNDIKMYLFYLKNNYPNYKEWKFK